MVPALPTTAHVSCFFLGRSSAGKSGRKVASMEMTCMGLLVKARLYCRRGSHTSTRNFCRDVSGSSPLVSLRMFWKFRTRCCVSTTSCGIRIQSRQWVQLLGVGFKT
jgi:hypothetical protein